MTISERTIYTDRLDNQHDDPQSARLSDIHLAFRGYVDDNWRDLFTSQDVFERFCSAVCEIFYPVPIDEFYLNDDGDEFVIDKDQLK